MPTLATVLDLETYLGQPVNPARATQMLDIAEAAVVAEIGWHPLQSTRTYTIDGPTLTVELPARNVTALTVTVNGLAYTTFTWTTYGTVRFGSPIQSGTITYTAGWPLAELAGVRGTVLDMAASKLDNPRNLRTWSLGDESETYMGSTAQNPLASDTRLVPFRLPPVVA